MSITKHVIKSCCGSSTTMLTTDKPIKKSHIIFFKNANYFIPDNYLQAGIFYVQLNSFIATASFGNTQINIQCSGQTCPTQIQEFEKLLEQAIHS